MSDESPENVKRVDPFPFDSDSDSDSESNSITETDTIDSCATAGYDMAFSVMIARFTQRLANYLLRTDAWHDLPKMLDGYAWIEHNPLLRTGANYDNILKLKEYAKDKDAPIHARKFAISMLTPADLLSLMPVIMRNEDRYKLICNGVPGMPTRVQLRAIYYFISMPDDIKEAFLLMPDMYKKCHEIVENAVSNKTAVSMLRANSFPDYLCPTTPLKNRKKTVWQKKKADKLLS